ncbi:MAG: HIT family protein [Betaproteobacteria bacterium HGW-Betaproteobacteria-11]|nr:MAG: HIT family protein [Betaproteobacteria bacterium HGW-Betaproteobacteria-11]
MAGCALCLDSGGELLWRDARCRVVRVTDAEGERFPSFCRVIWQAHVAEMSDLSAADGAHLLAVVLAVERMLREVMRPDKINLASLGNQVPHLHWHVIPRWRGDGHFPAPIWAAPAATGSLAHVPPAPASATLAAALVRQLGQALRGTPP